MSSSPGVNQKDNGKSGKVPNPLDGIKGKLPHDRRTNLTEDSFRSRGKHRRTNSRESENLSYDVDLDDKILDASHALRSLALVGRRGSGGELHGTSSSEQLNSVQQVQHSTVESEVGSTSDTEADVVTSTEKKRNDATTKVKEFDRRSNCSKISIVNIYKWVDPLPS